MRHVCLVLSLIVLCLWLSVQRGIAQEPPTSTLEPEAATEPSNAAVPVSEATRLQAPEIAEPKSGLTESSEPDRASAPSSETVARLEHALRLAVIDRQIQELQMRHSRLGVAGPIVLVATAGAVGTFLALGAIAEISFLVDAKREFERGGYSDYGDYNDDGVVDRTDIRKARRGVAGVSSMALTHLGLAAFGGWWLGHRLSVRHRLEAEQRKLKLERGMIEVKLDVHADKTSAMGMVVGTF